MNKNPYAPPQAPVGDVGTQAVEDYEYAGFWLRVCAWLVDTILLLLITGPLTFAVYGMAYLDENKGFVAGPADVFISYVMPFVLTIFFWRAKQATPGKMLLSIKILDAETRMPMSIGQSIGRYFAYIPSALVLMLGFFWIGWDERKQGWHDKLAGSIVVRFYK